MNVNVVDIDYPLNDKLDDTARHLLEKFYTREGEDIQESFARAAAAFSDSEDMANEIYLDVAKRQWAMFSSPILSNAPLEGEDPRGMPISCFLSYVGDTKNGLVEHQSELAHLSMAGGGVGGHLSDIRAVSGKSVGIIPHMKVSNAAVDAYRQGKTRKGSYAAYLDISHPDIIEFLSVRSPTGGDISRKCFNINHAVNLTDKFMEAVIDGRDFELECPHSGKVTNTLDARDLLERVVETRFRTGEPYINFIDTANEKMPEALKKLGLKIHGSNLCNEIHLPTDENRTAVCCLSSLNLAKYDEFKNDPSFIYRWVRLLDNVLTYFIENAPDCMHKAVYSAMRERSIGIGTMGFHTYLQDRMIPWSSFEAELHNKSIFKYISDKANTASLDLGRERGEAPDMQGTGYRNAHRIAVAPNANSANILGVSPSVEMWRSNAFNQITRAGTSLFVNPLLVKLLWENTPSDTILSIQSMTKQEWVDKMIQSVVLAKGSAQHLTFLSDKEKEVLKTAFETEARQTIKMAGDRQAFICQGQSINLYYPYGSDRTQVIKDHVYAWRHGLKGLYYLRTEAGFSGDKVSETVANGKLTDYEDKGETECNACQA